MYYNIILQLLHCKNFVIQLIREWIIQTVHAVSSKFESNAITSKVVCKVMVPGGILKSGTIIRECNTQKI